MMSTRERALALALHPRTLPLLRSIGVSLTAKGLVLPERLSERQWAQVGVALRHVASGLQWAVGDWLAYGEDTFCVKARKASRITGYDIGTLRNLAWVSRVFPATRRREGVPWSHHADVAGLPEAEQDYWLARAEAEAWTRGQLRQAIRAQKPLPAGQVRPDQDGQADAVHDDEATGHAVIEAQHDDPITETPQPQSGPMAWEEPVRPAVGSAPRQVCVTVGLAVYQALQQARRDGESDEDVIARLLDQGQPPRVESGPSWGGVVTLEAAVRRVDLALQRQEGALRRPEVRRVLQRWGLAVEEA